MGFVFICSDNSNYSHKLGFIGRLSALKGWQTQQASRKSCQQEVESAVRRDFDRQLVPDMRALSSRHPTKSNTRAKEKKRKGNSNKDRVKGDGWGWG